MLATYGHGDVGALGEVDAVFADQRRIYAWSATRPYPDSMRPRRPWPWKTAGLVLIVGLGLIAFSALNDSWLGFAAHVASFLVLIGWLLFLRRRGHWASASRSE